MVFTTFSPKLQALIREKGFIEPTLTQQMGIPEIMSGKNVLVIAPTGTGKTETAALGIFDKIHQNKEEPIALLYINPLRSLSRDLLDRLAWWADKLDLEIAVRHGDVSQRERAMQREVPPHVLITTPETLGAILTGTRMRQHLKQVKYVIVDEIHELVESKRGVQLSLLLERLRNLAGSFQRIGLSATVGSPRVVADFLGENVIVVHAAHEKKYDISVESPRPTAKDSAISDELLISTATSARLRRLYELIVSHRSVLAFTNTRETAEVLSSRLRQLDRELKQAVHHGSLSKEKRIKSEQEFKQQMLKSLIATSSLELGIDIGSIDLVIQYLSPRRVTRLIQRVGRSGHRVGATSKGVILSGDEDLFEATVIAGFAERGMLEPVQVHESALDVLATQVVGMTIDERDVTEERIYRTVKRSYPYRNIHKKDIQNIVQFLNELHLIFVNPSPEGDIIRRRRKSWPYYFENLSTIPDTTQYKVISVIENEPIGNLDEAFVAEHSQPGEKFICSGRAWRIIQVDKQKVTVEPIEDIESAIPAWEGELIPVPYEVAQEVGRLRRKAAEASLSRYKADAASAKEMTQIARTHREKHPLPDDKTLLVESYKDFVIVHACFGSLVNDTIAKYVGAKLTESTGVSVNIKTDPYRIMVQTTSTPEAIAALLQNATDIDATLMPALERSSLFKYRFLHVARRFGILSRGARLDRINMNRVIAAYVGSPCYKETLREILLEKMDVEKAQEVLARIAKGEIKIKQEQGLSYLGELGLVHKFSEIMKPLMPEAEIFSAFTRRLLATRVRLLCVNCGDYTLVKAVRSVEEQPDCPKCSSRLIACISRNKINAVAIVKKKIKKRELTKEETKEFLTTRRSADLVLVYGKRACIALAGYGIGPETAARILANLYTRKEEFLKSILAAEKQFAYTKKYWK